MENANNVNNTENLSLNALKIISKENADEMLDFVESEIHLLSEIKHDYIVAMHEYYVVDNSWYIRMELMEAKFYFLLKIIKFLRKVIYLNT